MQEHFQKVFAIMFLRAVCIQLWHSISLWQPFWVAGFFVVVAIGFGLEFFSTVDSFLSKSVFLQAFVGTSAVGLVSTQIRGVKESVVGYINRILRQPTLIVQATHPWFEFVHNYLLHVSGLPTTLSVLGVEQLQSLSKCTTRHASDIGTFTTGRKMVLPETDDIQHRVIVSIGTNGIFIKIVDMPSAEPGGVMDRIGRQLWCRALKPSAVFPPSMLVFATKEGQGQWKRAQVLPSNDTLEFMIRMQAIDAASTTKLSRFTSGRRLDYSISDAVKAVEDFLQGKDDRRHLNILAVGPPGVCKTTVGLAIAKEKGMHVVTPPSDMWHSPDAARRFCQTIPPGSMLLLDDMDAMGAAVTTDVLNPETSTGVVNLGNLTSFGVVQSVLDGVLTPPGVVIYMTTTRYDKLAGVIVRAGRVHMRVPFTLPSISVVQHLLTQRFSSETSQDIIKVAQAICTAGCLHVDIRQRLASSSSLCMFYHSLEMEVAIYRNMVTYESAGLDWLERTGGLIPTHVMNELSSIIVHVLKNETCRKSVYDAPEPDNSSLVFMIKEHGWYECVVLCHVCIEHQNKFVLGRIKSFQCPLTCTQALVVLEILLSAHANAEELLRLCETTLSKVDAMCPSLCSLAEILHSNQGFLEDIAEALREAHLPRKGVVSLPVSVAQQTWPQFVHEWFSEIVQSLQLDHLDTSFIFELLATQRATTRSLLEVSFRIHGVETVRQKVRAVLDAENNSEQEMHDPVKGKISQDNFEILVRIMTVNTLESTLQFGSYRMTSDLRQRHGNNGLVWTYLIRSSTNGYSPLGDIGRRIARLSRPETKYNLVKSCVSRFSSTTEDALQAVRKICDRRGNTYLSQVQISVNFQASSSLEDFIQRCFTLSPLFTAEPVMFSVDSGVFEKLHKSGCVFL